MRLLGHAAGAMSLDGSVSIIMVMEHRTLVRRHRYLSWMATFFLNRDGTEDMARGTGVKNNSRDDQSAAPLTAPVRPAFRPIEQHWKWCKHNGGVMGETGYEAPQRLRRS